MAEDKWFGVRTIYRHTDRSSGELNLYEERVVLIRAADQDEAIEKAEDEAGRYAAEDCEYLGYAMSFEIFEEAIEEGVEVFSLMRDHPLSPKEYIDRFFDTGAERSR